MGSAFISDRLRDSVARSSLSNSLRAASSASSSEINVCFNSFRFSDVPTVLFAVLRLSHYSNTHSHRYKHHVTVCDN